MVREFVVVKAFPHADRDGPVAPDLLDRRPSSLVTPGITFAHYDPPAPGWPCILLCRWPAAHVALVTAPADHFAWSAYTIEVMADPAARSDV